MGDKFCSVYTKADMSDLPEFGSSQTPSVQAIKVNTKGVPKLLKNIKPHKATGLDNIPGMLLIEAAEELAPGRNHLFQISVDSGMIPLDSKVSPAHSGFQERQSFVISKLQTYLRDIHHLQDPRACDSQ